ncbi:unnamed protein product [Hymenolepis diminuta]|uniref:Uncharacterized protein n=1 Tax=Hymenolepis diminuta TaxID=6216 RepID=A0A564YA82_HYMDI|nr:unnamed protein product [Hymenolepis diminuta]
MKCQLEDACASVQQVKEDRGETVLLEIDDKPKYDKNFVEEIVDTKTTVTTTKRLYEKKTPRQRQLAIVIIEEEKPKYRAECQQQVVCQPVCREVTREVVSCQTCNPCQPACMPITECQSCQITRGQITIAECQSRNPCETVCEKTNVECQCNSYNLCTPCNSCQPSCGQVCERQMNSVPRNRQNQGEGSKKVKDVILLNLDDSSSSSEDSISAFKSISNSECASSSSSSSSSSASAKSCNSSNSSSSNSCENKIFQIPGKRFLKKGCFGDDTIFLKRLKVKRNAITDYIRNKPKTTFLKKVKNCKNGGHTEYVTLCKGTNLSKQTRPMERSCT